MAGSCRTGTWNCGSPAMNTTFVDRLKALGIPATVDAYGPGTHSWPYWERKLHRGCRSYSGARFRQRS